MKKVIIHIVVGLIMGMVLVSCSSYNTTGMRSSNCLLTISYEKDFPLGRGRAIEPPSAAFSDDGKQIAIFNVTIFIVYDAESGKIISKSINPPLPRPWDKLELHNIQVEDIFGMSFQGNLIALTGKTDIPENFGALRRQVEEYKKGLAALSPLVRDYVRCKGTDSYWFAIDGIVKKNGEYLLVLRKSEEVLISRLTRANGEFKLLNQSWTTTLSPDMKYISVTAEGGLGESDEDDSNLFSIYNVSTEKYEQFSVKPQGYSRFKWIGYDCYFTSDPDIVGLNFFTSSRMALWGRRAATVFINRKTGETISECEGGVGCIFPSSDNSLVASIDMSKDILYVYKNWLKKK